ncbi:unnamed protein product [Hyaloperonospora brassicae]|uniref:Uncharacterized protein n=1 Tax=Hyaloperonospora brassicae TaxID=162125 RepID=A0AAV0T9F8_HYABA|nr:unnamed protein product [Hyaloperonospora brassicae]
MFPASKVTRATWRARDEAAELARIKRESAEKAEKTGNELIIKFAGKAETADDELTFAEKAEKTGKELTIKFEDMMDRRTKNEESIDTFIASQDYDDLIVLIHEANKEIPLEYAIQPLSFIMSKLSQNDQKILIEAAHGSAEPDIRELGWNLFRIYIRQHYNHSGDLKVIEPPKDKVPRT